MWLNLAAGVLSVPTTTSPTVTTGMRLSALQWALGCLADYRQRQVNTAPSPKWANHAARPSLVLVAPEYMFVSQRFNLSTRADLARNRFLEAGERDQILNALKTISAQFGKQLILVPGSIASREPLPQNVQQAEAAVEAARGKIESGAKFLQQGILGKSLPVSTAEAGKLDRFKPIHTPAAKSNLLDRMLNRHSNVQSYTASNVAYLFHEGRPVAQYAKRSDFHEVLPRYNQKDTVYIPGIRSGRATVGGINFGIEICLDHACGVLRHAPRVTADLPRVHLICSASVDTHPAEVLVREGGYVLHASSDPSATKIFRRLRGDQPPENPATRSNGPMRLSMGVIELDLHGR